MRIFTRYIMYLELCSLCEINFQAFIYSAKLWHKYLEIDKPCKKNLELEKAGYNYVPTRCK